MKKTPRRPRSTFRRNFSLERLESRAMCAVGDLDPSFDGDGKRTLSFLGPTDAENATAVALQPDGKIVAVGSFAFNGSALTDFAVARFNNDGSLDTSFGDGGRVAIDFGFVANNEQATSVAIQNNGKIVIGGYASIGGDEDFIVARLNSNGTLDSSFSADGKTSFSFGLGDTNNDRCFGVAIQTVEGQRKIVLVGSATVSGSFTDFAAVRYNDDGTNDMTFNSAGTPGSFSVSFGGTDQANAVAIDSSNRIVLAGTTSAFGTNDFAVLRLTAQGAADLTFGPGGMQTTDFGGDDRALAVDIQADGKIVAAGPAGPDFGIVRYTNTTGEDATFGGGDGIVTYDFGAIDVATGVAIQGSGRIVVGGYTSAGASGANTNNFAVARLNPTGLLDTSFNNVASPTVSDGDGKAVFDFGGDDRANGLALDGLERIVLAGVSKSADASSSNDFALARVSGNNLGSNLKLTDGVLTFSDPNGIANNLTVKRTATSLVFTDTATKIASNFGTAKTVVIPLSGVSRLVINTQGGDDHLRIDGTSDFVFTLGLSLNLGGGRDTLLSVGDFNFTMASAQFLAGSVRGTHTGVERVILQGGAGANRLDTRSFSGTAVLDGGAGADTLLAGNGRNILIGGLGLDVLIGGTNEDILIGGTTLNVLNANFVALVDKWAGPGAYATRISQIRNGTGLPAGVKLTPATVPDDNAKDTITGGTGLDWFWAYTSDFLKDKAGNETLR